MLFRSQGEYIKIIKHNNELLLRLVGDILDLSRFETGSFDIRYETFDAVDIFQELYTSFAAGTIGTELKLIANNHLRKCIITLDRNRLTQIGFNFLSNAFKFTQSGQITFTQKYVDGGIYLSVTDTGIGIDQDKHHLIFRRFEKLDSFTQGTGLGLAICKAITEALHGEIGFDSVKGQGSTFWVWVPCEVHEIVLKEACIGIC